MKILIAYRAIDNIAGGVEKMSTTLMNALCERGHELHFLTLDHKDATSFYPMDERITWHKLDVGDWREKATWGVRFQRFQKGREILKSVKPDVILGFQDGAFFQMRAYSLGMDIPVILAERIAPSHFNFTKAGKMRAIKQRLYNWAAKITVQCESYRDEYPEYLKDKIVTIPNPVNPVQETAEPQGTDDKAKILLCVGRLGYQKNQALLLKAFASLHKNHPDWRLVLAGGDEIEATKELTEVLDLQDHVDILGPVKDVASLYQSAQLFCLPSRWEGFPNALAEAMSYGLPAVGFKECGGVRDLIAHGKTGYLAQGNDNLQTLSAALDQAMNDHNFRLRAGKAAKEAVKAYQPQAIFDLWETLLKDIVQP